MRRWASAVSTSASHRRLARAAPWAACQALCAARRSLASRAASTASRCGVQRAPPWGIRGGLEERGGVTATLIRAVVRTRANPTAATSVVRFTMIGLPCPRVQEPAGYRLTATATLVPHLDANETQQPRALGAQGHRTTTGVRSGGTPEGGHPARAPAIDWRPTV